MGLSVDTEALTRPSHPEITKSINIFQLGTVDSESKSLDLGRYFAESYNRARLHVFSRIVKLSKPERLCLHFQLINGKLLNQPS
jgi:hypothetical protein